MKIFFVIVGLFFILRIDREIPVDKSKLFGHDYRLFQGTPAWGLAKAVQDERIDDINAILSNNHKLIDSQEPIFNNTLLKMSLVNEQIKPFKCLVENGANLELFDNNTGTSVLIEACNCRWKSSEYAEILIQHGANVNFIEVGPRKKGNSVRETPLMAATSSGKINLVKMLVEKGADINYKNEYNRSALSRATIFEFYDIVYYLLISGADFTYPIMKVIDNDTIIENDTVYYYLKDILRRADLPLDSPQYQYKMQVVEFLRNKGIEYKNVPIPDFIIYEAKKNYPNNWQEYLERY